MRSRVEQAVEAFKANPPPLPVDQIAEAMKLGAQVYHEGGGHRRGMVHRDCRLGDVQRQSVDGWGNWGFAVLPNAAGRPVVSLTYAPKPKPRRRMT